MGTFTPRKRRPKPRPGSTALLLLVYVVFTVAFTIWTVTHR